MPSSDEVRLYMIGYDLAKPDSMSDAIYEAKLRAIEEFVKGDEFLEAGDIVESTWFVTTNTLQVTGIKEGVVAAITAKRVNGKPVTMDANDKILIIRLWPHDPAGVAGYHLDADVKWLTNRIKPTKK